MLDRNKGKIVDFIVLDNRIENAYLLMYKILTNNENKNFNIEYHDTLNTIDYLSSDSHHVYEKVTNPLTVFRIFPSKSTAVSGICFVNV